MGLRYVGGPCGLCRVVSVEGLEVSRNFRSLEQGLLLERGFRV